MRKGLTELVFILDRSGSMCGLERDTIHSPNESYLLSQLYKGMESIALFYRYF